MRWKEPLIPHFKPGDIKIIYGDPLAFAQIEGKAKLLECLIPDGDGRLDFNPGLILEEWKVEFCHNGSVVERLVVGTRFPIPESPPIKRARSRGKAK